MFKKVIFKAIIASIIALAGYHAYVYSSGRDTVTCSNVVAGSNQNVKGQQTNCGPVQTEKESFNAAGDKTTWNDTAKAKKGAEKWGVIAKKESHTLKFPKAGEKKIISLTPTQGAYQNRSLDILLVSFDKRASNNNISSAPQAVQDQFARLSEDVQFNSMIKIYRKTEKESLWTELYEIFSEEYPQKLEIKVSVFPDGIIKTEQTISETDGDGNRTDIKPFEIDLATFE